jgi:hypothetical protein
MSKPFLGVPVGFDVSHTISPVYWVADFIILGWIGQKPVESPYIEVGVFATIFYFVFLLVIIPVVGLIEEFLLKQSTKTVEDLNSLTETARYEIKL